MLTQVRVMKSFIGNELKPHFEEEKQDKNEITLNDETIYKYLLKTLHGNKRKGNAKKDLLFVDPQNFLITVNNVLEEIIDKIFETANNNRDQ